MKARLCIIAISFLMPMHLSAQSNLSLKYFGVTIHPFGDDLAHLQPGRLDKNAYVVLNTGGFIEYEKYIWEDILAVSLANGIFSDCSNGLSSISHAGLQLLVAEKGKHRLYVDFGPSFYIREDWNRFDEYEDQGNFSISRFKNKSWQHRVFWYSGLIEYDYDISPPGNLFNEYYTFSRYSLWFWCEILVQ